MPLATRVGRKSLKARLSMGLIYGILTLGALTTVYPFLVMVATGFKGATDQNDNRLVPLFWTDGSELEKKWLDDKYSGNAAVIAASAVGADASPQEVEAWNQKLMQLPLDRWTAGFRTQSGQITGLLSMKWQNFLRQKYGDVETVNRVYVELNPAFQRIQPPPELLDRVGWSPKMGEKWEDWLEFKATLPAHFRVPITTRRLWQEFLRSEAKNQLGSLPPEVVGSAKTFEQLEPTRTGALWEKFLQKGIPPRLKGVELDGAWATQPPPILAADRAYVRSHASQISWEFTSRNYRIMLDYILLNGRALLNTVIFCTLAVLVQLIVNPLCAYALSRFPMKATAQILLFLLATMAFPAEVAMIPSFLLLKDLGLLNTFAALVLPAAASGFMIFLLKGFFDSLPKEIFESGQIDGAPEWLMMLRLAFPLSRPVLGYLALLAFMGAYGSFMYAFLVAQNRDMWTLMVFIYQMQGFAPKATIMAGLTLAALPTLAVFLAAQKVIMRGIVLPEER